MNIRDRRDQNQPESVRTHFVFTYSGIKTAVLRYVETHNMRERVEKRQKAISAISQPKLEDYLAACDQETLDLIASFQRAIVGDLVSKTLTAARACDAATLFVTGGLAANPELRRTFQTEPPQDGLPAYF